jgi:AcrR family transcriptional regulator
MKRSAVPAASATRGRPRSFDRDLALERAMEVFWRQGYEPTSMTDLTRAIGINPPSLYAAFGDKERLFLEAVERYHSGVGSREALLARAPTARTAVERLLRRTALGLSARRRGCMLVTSTMNCSAPRVQAALAAYRASVESSVRKRIERGVREGELPAGTDAAALAKFYETVVQGLSSQARDGATRRSLLAVVAAAMRAWPGSGPEASAER